jgi:hypothetical protein
MTLGHPVNRKFFTLPFTGLLWGEEAPSQILTSDSPIKKLMGWPLLLTPGYYMCLGYQWSHEFSLDIISPCIPLATDCFAKAIRGSTSPDLELTGSFSIALAFSYSKSISIVYNAPDCYLYGHL